MGNGWVWDPSIQRLLKKGKEKTHPLYGAWVRSSTGLNPMASSFTPSGAGQGIDDDNVSVSTDASCITGLSLETLSTEETGYRAAFL